VPLRNGHRRAGHAHSAVIWSEGERVAGEGARRGFIFHSCEPSSWSSRCCVRPCGCGCGCVFSWPTVRVLRGFGTMPGTTVVGDPVASGPVSLPAHDREGSGILTHTVHKRTQRHKNWPHPFPTHPAPSPHNTDGTHSHAHGTVCAARVLQSVSWLGRPLSWRL
jgi:hypothetical protein